MTISLQFLVIVTLVLSFILFFVEHEAQPDVYDNGWTSVVWAFVQYIGDPGGFGDTPPITFTGRIIACIIGILGIAIFAVPAGLIASAFSEVINDEKSKRKDAENAQRIIRSMHCHCSLLKGVRFWPRRWLRFTEITTFLDIDETDIISAVRNSPDLRLRDLSTWLTASGGVKPEMMAVEILYANSPYGYTNLREEGNKAMRSNVTIVAPAANSEAGLAYYAYHLARVGGFNVVINERLSSNADLDEDRCIVAGIYDYQYNDEKNYPKLHQYVDDIKTCASSSDNWVIVLNAAATPKEEEKKYQKIRLRLSVDDDKKENVISDCTGTEHHDILQAFFDDVCDTMSKEHNIEPYLDFIKGKPTTLRNYIRNRLDNHPNVIEIDISDDYRVFGTDVKAQWTSIYNMACLIHRHFDKDNTECNCLEWKTDDIKKNRLPLIPRHKGE